MAHIIHSYLGLDVKLPTDQNGLSGLYRSVLSGKKALILLDNAADRAQVEPLLPPLNCALLVTSRNKFALPGLKEKDLDVLSLGDAKDLLLSICERISEHAGELANLCGCLPLALRNAAYVLKEKPNLSVANYAKRLENAKKRLELVEASFTLSYQLLTPEMQRLWSLLSVFPADFDLLGAAAVWQTENDAAEDALGELVKWSLVDFLPSAADEDGRYKLHDLARDFADSRLDDAGREPARLRHARYYQKLLWAANELFMQVNNSLEMGLVLFDMNWMSIKAGQKWASENKLRSNEIAEICSNFAWTGPILNLRLHPLTCIEWLNEALVAARETNNRDAEEDHLGNLGLANFHLSDASKAIEYYNQALKFSREIGDRQGEVSGLGNLANVYSHLGDTHKAIEYYNQSLKISYEIGDVRGYGNHLCNLGQAYSYLGYPRKAIEYYDESLKIFRGVGYRQGEANNLGNLGVTYFHLGYPRKAIDYYDKGLKISREIGDQRGESADLCNLGQVYVHLGDLQKAIECYDKGLKISREIDELVTEGNLLGNLGLAYLYLSDHRKATEYCEQAIKISHEIGYRQGEAEHLSSLGTVHSCLGDHLKAIEYYEQAIKISREIGYRKGEAECLGNFGNAYLRLGDLRTAIEYYEHALKFSREIGDRRGEGIHLFNMSISLYNLGQRDKAIPLAESALAIFEEIESPHAETVRKALAEWKC